MAPKFWLKLLHQGVEQMTLSGNLDFVPLDEVLRLLTRAGNDGAVEITSAAISGRVFVTGKGIGVATTLSDHSFREHLITSGYVTADELTAIESGQAPMSTLEDDGSELIALVREMTVESIYQMETKGADFQVVKDAASPYAAPIPFDLETIVRDSRERASEWAKVSKVITNLESPITINRVLESDTVELDRGAWRLISEIGSGASVHELAGRLGTTDFAIAKVAAGMAERGLVDVEPQTSTPVEEAADYDFYAVADAAVSSAPATNPQESWWEEPETSAPVAETPAETASEASTEIAETETSDVAEEDIDAVVSPAVAEEVNDAVVAENDDAVYAPEPASRIEYDNEPSTPTADSEGEGDADAFLEKVFSELGPAEEEESEGHGLMRRRRMGSILRELGED